MRREWSPEDPIASWTLVDSVAGAITASVPSAYTIGPTGGPVRARLRPELRGAQRRCLPAAALALGHGLRHRHEAAR